MDLRYGDSEPTDDERAAVDALLGPPTSFWEGAERSEADLRRARPSRDRRHLLLPGLLAINDRVGWISEGALAYLCRRLTVPPAEAYGVATFSPLFSVRPRPATVLRVCTDLVCTAAGASGLCTAVEERLGNGVHLERSPCLGLCERAPAALVTKAGDPVRTAVSAPATVEGAVLAARAPDSAPEEPPAETAVPQTGQDGLLLLSRVGAVDPSSLDDYRAHGGYTALRRAFALGPAGVARAVLASGPAGQGGAFFPTGRVWQAAASPPDHRPYLVCNAGESAPGAFRDRVLMEGDPFALVEAMTIAAYAIGAHRGFLCLRDAFPRATSRMRHAVEQARTRGLLGDDVLGRGYAFDIEIRRGAGAYVCGEETALFNSIEGHRGEPHCQPLSPAEQGLFGRPTAVHDVETLVGVLPILALGAPAYAATGTEKSIGTQLFCVSGSVERPGVYELPSGATPAELLSAAGVRENLRAVLLGGATGGFVRPDELDVPFAFEGRAGSGVVMAFDDTVPLPRLLLRIAEFFRDESCGRCVPCRVGTVRQEEALRRIVERAGAAAADDIALLRDVGRAMRDASMCGLGQNAWNAVESAVDRLGVYG
ncbi:NADH-ubiquinone oxidoreductase-F iron-sulfur binding region domain-containing protein [Streptomyces doebereineriae]|uniref:NADH-ubiquinone oxidoreductase-F iron-sulfur binding region domain-containing protein n=1 Tax=Streptomyces doebereineriae TaxID=3075528 RepID=A0ABU2VB77_9ACTN|nr:NADH-ubiquinone oxidoreductase-F iron-sulfur binding region domain-containing protein [Streptomyces sp. DSM 41640]MDT0482807.1 NADH-ubiquinone oxidoreductase-F iron-sulfur binding region domain-containing protein [Streptomyces sp. DSM 41640]